MNPSIGRIGVIGFPIRHSLSPLIFQHWLEQYHIKTFYEKIQIKPNQLDDFLSHLRDNDFLGVNLTLPHKEAGFDYARQAGWAISANAMMARSINSLHIGEHKIEAFSSDGAGFINNLRAQAPQWREDSPIFLIGAGGAASAIAFQLAKSGAKHMRISNRTRSKAQILAKTISEHIADSSLTIEIIDWDERSKALDDIGLLVQASSLGMAGQAALDLDISALPPSALVADIVYRPLYTALLQNAKQRGLAIIDGLGMLLHQAKPVFEAWFDQKVEITPTLRQKLILAL